jgi:hypothetical protein
MIVSGDSRAERPLWFPSAIVARVSSIETPHPAPKSLALAYVLCVFAGVFGAHYFYLGVTRRAVLYLLTFGCLTFGVLIDLFTLPAEVRRINRAASAQG